MRITGTLLVLCLVAGCRSGPAPARDSRSTSEPGDDSRSTQLQRKRQELQQVERNLDGLKSEREGWASRPPSDRKEMRLQEIAYTEQEYLKLCDQLRAEIAAIESNQDTTVDALRALEMMEEATKTEEQLAEQRRREQEDAEVRRKAEEAARLASEAAARAREEELAQARERMANAGARTGDDLTFEERWADVILKVRLEMQRQTR